MKPTTIILPIVAILFATTFVSCNNRTKVVEETPANEYADSDSEYTDSGEELFCNYMSMDQWPQDTFFADMVEVYNCSVLLNGIKSVRDVWKRYQDSEFALESLKHADVSMITSKDFKEKFVHCLNLAERFFTEHVDYSDSLLYRQWSDSLNCLDSSLCARFHSSNYSDFTEEQYWQTLNWSKQSKDLFSKVGQDLITEENINTRKVQKDIAFLQKNISEESNFNKKCAYTMEYVYYMGFYNTDFGMIEDLLDDGRYSPYLYFLWRIWRCGVQLCGEDYGPSTWSTIPNKLYNEKRHKIAENTLKYIVTHRDDGIAINQYLVTSTHPNILRFGDFDLGNESFTELHNMSLGTR